MIPIKKQAEPRGLKNAKRTNKNLTYQEFSEEQKYKEAFFELRKYLLEEQGKICCYCQRKIPSVLDRTGVNLMKTEHFIPKKGVEKDVSKELEYGNLLAACLGNSHQKGNQFRDHCDSSKGNRRLSALPNPAKIRQSGYRHLLRYKVREKLDRVDLIAYGSLNNSLKTGIKNDIKLLNLNEQKLRNKRYQVWRGLWRVVYKRGRINMKRLLAILGDYNYTNNATPTDRNFKEFCGFITQWFEHRFRDELERARKASN